MIWRYQITRQMGFGGVEYAVREVYLRDDGSVEAWTRNPIDIAGDTVAEVLTTLDRIRKDHEQFGVLDIPADENGESDERG